jgi:hypothetical protein
MAKRINFSLLVLLLFVLPNVRGQGVRVTYIGYNSFESMPGKEFMNYGLGYEQNLASHIAVSLEYFKSYGLGDETWGEYSNADANSNDFIYIFKAPWREFTYTSKFFFSGNDVKSAYLATGIGYRQIDFSMSTQNYNSSSPDAEAISRGAPLQRITMVPIYLKIGSRGEIDGWFGDYFIGLNFNPGAGNQKSGNQTIDNLLNEKYFRTFSFTFGLAFGLGWAD